MKVLRICRQGGDDRVYQSKEDLRTSLIDLHMQDVLEDELCNSQMIKNHKNSTLDGLCSMFDWEYKIISNKEAEQYEKI